MEEFNSKLLVPSNGRIETLLFKNAFLGIPETLFYQIQVNFHPLIFKDETITPSAFLDSIKLNINQLTNLEGAIFEFPINPEQGCIDGSIYLFDVHNPFDVKRIKFATFENNTIKATLHYNVDFEYENTGYQNITDAELTVNLQLGELSIDPEIINPDNFNPKIIKDLLSKFTALDDYEEPENIDGRITFKVVKH